MSKKLLLERVQGEERLAVLEDFKLLELYVSRGEGSPVGALYVGRVQNVSAGLNAAFVDIGLDKNAYLSAADCWPSAERIGDALRPGQEILVQVIKEPGGSKGCRVSMRVTLPGRVCVLKPMDATFSISHRIEDIAERERLTAIADESLTGSGCGAILRTAAEGCAADLISEELHALVAQWRALYAMAAVCAAPARLAGGEDLATMAVRDCLDEDVTEILADDEAMRARLEAALRKLAPSRLSCLCPIGEGASPFDAHRVDAQLEKAMRRVIWLDSGGFLAIDETEAMTVIDVNTGKFTGGKTLDDTVLRINLEAAREIARLLRLRALGGIIIVDFIDMATQADRQALKAAMEEAVRGDRAQVTVVDITPLGLMELTRRRTRMPLSRQLYHLCEDCGGRGFVPSHESTARRAIRALWTRAHVSEQRAFRLTAHRAVVDWVRTIGAPEGLRVELCIDNAMAAEEYRIEA